MINNLKIFLILSIAMLFFIGCSQRTPITWEERIVQHQPNALFLVYSEYGVEHQETILFLHGFGENRHTWRFLVPELSKKYHLIMLDLKGFGDSPKYKDEAYSVYDQAQLVNRFIEKRGLTNLTLVGRSFGGGVALVMALIQRDGLSKRNLEKLVLIDSMSYHQQLPSMMRSLNKPFIGYLGIHLLSNEWIAEEGYKYAFYNDDLIPKESIRYTANYLAYPLAKYAYLKTVSQLIPDDILTIEKRYKEITLPTLILWGREDVSISVNKGYRLARELKNSHLRVLPHVGHMAQEERPSVISLEILKFMDSH